MIVLLIVLVAGFFCGAGIWHTFRGIAASRSTQAGERTNTIDGIPLGRALRNGYDRQELQGTREEMDPPRDDYRRPYSGTPWGGGPSVRVLQLRPGSDMRRGRVVR